MTGVFRHDIRHVLVPVMEIIGLLAAMRPHERTCRDWLGRVPRLGIAVVVRDLKVAVVGETL